MRRDLLIDGGGGLNVSEWLLKKNDIPFNFFSDKNNKILLLIRNKD